MRTAKMNEPLDSVKFGDSVESLGNPQILSVPTTGLRQAMTAVCPQGNESSNQTEQPAAGQILPGKPRASLRFLQTAEKLNEIPERPCGGYQCAMTVEHFLGMAQVPAAKIKWWRKRVCFICRWHYLRLLVVCAASVLLLFGIITYFLWLNDVNAARHKYLQTRSKLQNQTDLESSEMLATSASVSQPLLASTLLHQLGAAATHDAADLALLNTNPSTKRIAAAPPEAAAGLITEKLAKITRLYAAQRQPNLDTTSESPLRIFLTKVSPTIPPIHFWPPTTTMSTTQNTLPQENGCESTSLPMCQSVLDYDLTYSSSTQLNDVEQSAFALLAASNCSARAMEFICTLLEPECRPSHIGVLLPCRRICKSIFEACSIEISSSDTLSAIFDCGIYPDSNDVHFCEDPTRRRQSCYAHEFACHDRSCIPYQWQCDNIKDCAAGEDEADCLLCEDQEQFRCRSNEKCIAASQRCDQQHDCADGSDEANCEDHIAMVDAIYDRQDAVNLFANNFTPNEATANSSSSTPRTFTAAKPFNVSEMGVSREEVTNFVPFENIAQGFVYFRDSKEIMMTSDTENKFKFTAPRANRTHIKSTSTTKSVSSTTAAQVAATTKAPPHPPQERCAPHQLRCVSGHCITVQQICDKTIDCPDGADELMCVYKDRTTTAMRRDRTVSTTVKPETRATRSKAIKRT